MIREERTRGLGWDEPSMEDPTLTNTKIRWFPLASQVSACRTKLAELVERANRALTEIRDGRGRYRRQLRRLGTERRKRRRRWQVQHVGSSQPPDA